MKVAGAQIATSSQTMSRETCEGQWFVRQSFEDPNFQRACSEFTTLSVLDSDGR